MNLRSPDFGLREFSESVKELDIQEIQDAVLEEIWIISTDCRRLGFGNMPKKGSKARRYYDDLNSIVPLTLGTIPEFREGLVDEARAMLFKISRWIISLQNLSSDELEAKLKEKKR